MSSLAPSIQEHLFANQLVSNNKHVFTYLFSIATFSVHAHSRQTSNSLTLLLMLVLASSFILSFEIEFPQTRHTMQTILFFVISWSYTYFRLFNPHINASFSLYCYQPNTTKKKYWTCASANRFFSFPPNPLLLY